MCFKYLSAKKPSQVFKHIYEADNKNIKNMIINIVNSELKDLKKEIEKMSQEERKIEKQDNIVEIVEEILKFNKQKQEGQGIKILTPSQMLSRLLISLAQLQAEINSEKLKNEIRQLLYSLYYSKNITKQVYNNLMKPIWINNNIIIIVIIIIVIIIIIIVFIVTIKGICYKKERQFLWIQRRVKRMNQTDLN